MPDEPNAESSTAVVDEVEQESGLKPIEEFTPEEHAEWRKSGKIPESKKADSTPAEDASPDSSTGNKQQGKQSKTDQRFQELLRERSELRERVARLEGKLEGVKPPDSPNGDKPKEPEKLVKPSSKDFDTWAEYEDALELYREKREEQRIEAALKADREARKKEAEQERANEATKTVAEQYTDRANAFAKDHPDFYDLVRADKVAIESQVISEFIIDSGDAGLAVQYHLAQNPGESKRIAELSPTAAMRELLKIEAQVVKPTSNGKAASPAPKISKATPPVTELSGAAAVPDDEADAALARKDFVAYRDIMNRRELAKRKGR